jgi:hypothetical protein
MGKNQWADRRQQHPQPFECPCGQHKQLVSTTRARRLSERLGSPPPAHSNALPCQYCQQVCARNLSGSSGVRPRSTSAICSVEHFGEVLLFATKPRIVSWCARTNHSPICARRQSGGCMVASFSAAKIRCANLPAFRPETRNLSVVRQKFGFPKFASWKFSRSTPTSRKPVEAPRCWMNLKSSAKNWGCSLRTKGASNFACQYKHSLNTLPSYSDGGHSNRLQTSNWNFCLATAG